MMEKIPHIIGKWILPLRCGLGICYSIGRKYRPMWVSVTVLDLNQNSGFGRTLEATASSHRHVISKIQPLCPEVHSV